MNRMLQIVSLVCLVVLLSLPAEAQWRCLYATLDDDVNNVNATGYNTPSVGVISENFFIALVARRGTTGCGYFIPYVNADSSHGRRYSPGYAADAYFDMWSDGAFDQDILLDCQSMVVMPDSFIYVANNNVDHNILVFKYLRDTVTVVPVDPAGTIYPRQMTGSKSIFGITVDKAGYVYVCNDTSNGVTDDIKIYKPIRQWSGAHNDAPIRTIDLPDGVYKGLCASPDGKMLFVSDYTGRKVVKYVGSPTTGYTKDNTFSFTMSAADTVPVSTTLRPGPIGMGYLSPNNILAVACDVWGTASVNYTYSYGRIYLLNPKTGALISTDSTVSVVDQAAWNLKITGGYSSRPNQLGTASGYASTWAVAWDENKNLYSQSYFGWTVEKWNYDGTLPTIPVTGVEEIGGILPEGYALHQNYPNPFNPVTNIEFSLPISGFVSLKVYDLLGREVMTLVNEEKTAGAYRASFDASSLPSGTYLYTLRAGAYQETKKMVLVK